MNFKNYFFVPFFLAIVSVAFAQNEQNIDQGIDNISAEYAVCATYFSIVYHAMSSSNRKDIADKYGDLQETAIEYALLLASQGRDPETAGKVTMARMKISNQEMQKEANYNNANISILIEKYQNKCIEAINNPESMVK